MPNSFQQTILSPTIVEGTSGRLTLQLRDEADEDLAIGDLDTVTLTLKEKETGSILNSRDAQSILNANGGTIDADASLSLLLSDDDNALLDAANPFEYHVAVIRWTFNGKSELKEVLFRVVKAP